MNLETLTNRVLDFWFGTPDSAELGATRDVWFNSTPEFDQEIRNKFGAANSMAAEGKLDDLMQMQRGTLALIILLDQFSRNIFRGKAAAFANDEKARCVAESGLQKGYDERLLTVEKKFFYLPFEHAEDLEFQEKSIMLFIRLGDSDSLRHALCHRDQILRFGRFPDRNQALGRENSKAELAFLKQPFC
ncbi:MAG: DUF924 family protein [Methylococcaceae bacterium]|jgi:uncharacterized protein (DUF924 family)